MKFTIPKQGENLVTIARKIGYNPRGWRNDEFSMERSFGRNPYPRLHIYIRETKNEYIFSLHLDQKRPSYEGTSAHGGEYEGEVVEREAGRIEGILKKGIQAVSAASRSSIVPEKKKRLWFRAKRYGWGWYPITWEGWLTLVLFCIASVKLFLFSYARAYSAGDAFGFFIPFFLILVAILIGICYSKGEKPHWRWGDELK